MGFSKTELEFKLKANDIRRLIIEMIYRAGSGHPGPSLSCVEELLILFEAFLRFRPDDPSWPDRDRVILSKGHAAPALYAHLASYYDHVTPEEIIETFRQASFDPETGAHTDTRAQGHPDMNLMPGVELSTGSLGNGLGFACSMVQHLRMRWRDEGRADPQPRVFCILGDGELDEGSCREAIMYAGSQHMHNLVVIVDNNRHQLTGKKQTVMDYGAVRDQFNPNQWNIIDRYRVGDEINGHDYTHLHYALSQALLNQDRPSVVVASTIKGKGASFMEDDAAYHGVPPMDDEYEVCMKVFDITERILKKRLAALEKETNNVSVEMDFTQEGNFAPREAYGRALYLLGKKDPRIVRLDADLRSSCKGDLFYNHFPERCYETGIAEAMMTLLSGAFAREGKIPFTNTFSIFYLKAMEVLRNVIAYNNLNVKIVGSHGDPRLKDGGSHADQEMLGILRTVPNMRVVQPADGPMTFRLIEAMIREVGPIFIRFGRDKIPIIYNGRQDPAFGRPVDNSPTLRPIIGRGHLLKEGRHVTLVAVGDMVHAALLAAGRLEKEGIEPTVIDMYSIKPIDEELLTSQADKPVVTVEPHNVLGGLGSAVGEVLSARRPQWVERVGIRDHFTKSGDPSLLSERYGLTPAAIVAAARRVLDRAG